jgi:hypothetical protein
MTRIGALSATALVFIAVAAPAFAQDGRTFEGRYWRGPNGYAYSGRSNLNFGMQNNETSGPGDFAVTGGLSDHSRAWNPTGQVDPGTSNSPAGNAGGE